MKILFIGDVVGKAGRKAINQLVPQLRTEVAPDLVVANIENLAHGKGITTKTFEEIKSAGVDFYTGGNHSLAKPEANSLFEQDLPLIRPANFDAALPGKGFKEVAAGSRKVLVINLVGQVFITDAEYRNPFKEIDQILAQINPADYAAIIVDFHAEATSEKLAFAHYVDGRVSAVFGTHTHVPTADAHVMPGGTAYVTDVGMVGIRDSVIGVGKEAAIRSFLQESKLGKTVPEEGLVDLGAVLVEVDPASRKAGGITRLDRTVQV